MIKGFFERHLLLFINVISSDTSAAGSSCVCSCGKELFKKQITNMLLDKKIMHNYTNILVSLKIGSLVMQRRVRILISCVACLISLNLQYISRLVKSIQVKQI